MTEFDIAVEEQQVGGAHGDTETCAGGKGGDEQWIEGHIKLVK